MEEREITMKKRGTSTLDEKKVHYLLAAKGVGGFPR